MRQKVFAQVEGSPTLDAVSETPPWGTKLLAERWPVCPERSKLTLERQPHPWGRVLADPCDGGNAAGNTTRPSSRVH